MSAIRVFRTVEVTYEETISRSRATDMLLSSGGVTETREELEALGDREFARLLADKANSDDDLDSELDAILVESDSGSGYYQAEPV